MHANFRTCCVSCVFPVPGGHMQIAAPEPSDQNDRTADLPLTSLPPLLVFSPRG